MRFARRHSRAIVLATLSIVLVSCSDLLDPDKPHERSVGFALVGAAGNFGTLGGPHTYAYAVNDDSVVVGLSTVATDFREHAIKWTSSTGLVALFPSYPASTARGINASGVIVGNVQQTTGGPTRAFRLGLNGIEIFGTGKKVNVAHAVNASGVMVGEENNTPVRWDASGTKTSLGTLGGPTGSGRAINDSGVIVGSSTNSSGSPRAFKWTSSGGMQALPLPPGYTISAAYGINNAGQIVGDVGAGARPVLWEPDGTVRILANEAGRAYGINELGQVVGALSAGSDDRAFVWDAADSLRAIPQPGASVFALAINEHGLIVGTNYWQIVPLSVDLNCPATVVRADSITCTATSTPNAIAASQILFKWRFDSDSVRAFPAMAYEPLPPVGDSALGMVSWPGKVVISGRVTVYAKWRSQTDSTFAHITVTSRSGPFWGDLPITFASDTFDLPTDSTLIISAQPPAQPGGHSGVAGINFDTITGDGNWIWVIDGLATVDSVLTGPNRGYWYVTQPGMRSARGAKIRTWFTGRESPKFSYLSSSLTNRGLLQARVDTAGQSMHPDSLVALTGSWAHEGRGHAGAKGHQGQMELAATDMSSCGKVPAILERVVGPDEGATRFRTAKVKDEGIRSLWAAADHSHVFGNVVNGKYYESVFSTTVVTPSMGVVTWPGDMQLAADTLGIPLPDFRCDRVY